MRPLFTRCALFLISTLLSAAASAGILTGVVRDTKGEPLPFATVFVQGTTNGTVANASGIYQLPLPAGTYNVTCQYIGYQQAVFHITIGATEEAKHDFRLTDQALEMKEVVVHASDEDPAYRIIRQAISKRDFHLRQVKEFQTSIYLKGVLRTRQTPNKVMGQKIDKGEMGLDSNGKGVLYLCEEMADYYAQIPNKSRTVIHSVRESGDPNGMGFAQIPPVITFYENNVNIIDNLNPRGFVSPIASGALGFYKYKLEGEFKEGRHVIYKIRVTPKRAYEPLFFGHIYIVDGDWAIHSLSLTTSARYGLEKLDTLHLDQLFLPLKKDTWVIKNQLFYPTIEIFGFGITGNFVTVYDNQKVNEPVPDTIFKKKIISTYDKTANKKDTTYWEEVRPLPLEIDEARDYKLKDSLRLALENPHRVDSIRKRENRITPMELALTGITINDSGYRQSLYFASLISIINYNSVEGVNLAPQITYTRKLDTGNSLSLRTAIRYGFHNTHFNAIGALTYTHADKAWRGRGYSITGEAGKYVFQYNKDNPVTPFFNAFTTLLFNYNELKIYERWNGAVSVRRNLGNGIRWFGRVAYEHRMPLENTTDFSFVKKKDSSEFFTDNLPKELRQWHFEEHDAVLIRLGIAWRPGYSYIQYPDYKLPVPGHWPLLTLMYEKGIPNILGSNIDWDKWRFNITGDTRLKLLGSISYNLSVGGFLSKKWVGVSDLTHLFAGDDPAFTLASPYMRAFQLAPFYRYSNDNDLYGEAHIEYNMQGLLTNKIPGLRQAKWYLVLGTNSFYAGPNNYFTEAFVSIDNLGFKIYRVLRLDFLRGWDHTGRTYNGIRIGLLIPALNALRGGGADIEW
jgi:hypothetical protein